MKLNPEQHGKGREVETQGRRSSFARARSQLTQAVGDVLAGRVDGKRQGGWLTAFTALSPTASHADRLREVVIRDRALAAANPGPRRTLREEEEAEAALAAERVPADLAEGEPAEASSDDAHAADLGADLDADLDSDLTTVASLSDVLGASECAPESAPAVVEDEAVRALADALDAAARAERTPDEATPDEAATTRTVAAAGEAEPAPAPVEAAAGAEPAVNAASADETVALAEPPAAPTPLEQIAAKATKVKSKAGAREGSARPKREPIRTRTMARLLASQGHKTRALSIYDELISADTSDASLREEAEALRSQAE